MNKISKIESNVLTTSVLGFLIISSNRNNTFAK